MGKDQDLLDAARCGNIAAVGKILEHIMKRSLGPLSSFRRHPNINVQDMNGYTPLHHACLNGHINIVRQLLAHGSKPDVPDIRGSTPLYLAAWAGHSEIMKMLLFHPQQPANPNAQTIENDTPLHCAAQHGHNAALSTLLAYGADPTIRNNSFQTALDLAAQFGRLQAVQTLIRTHPELIEPYKQPATAAVKQIELSTPHKRATPTKHIYTHTCLHLASRNGHKKVVETLLTAGVDVNILTHAGSALHEAATCGKKSVAVTLLKTGIDTAATDGNGRTVLDVLKEYPPHVTYEIVSTISDFCNENRKRESPFQPIHGANGLHEYLNIKHTFDEEDKPHSLPKAMHHKKCFEPIARRVDSKPMNIESNGYTESKSLESIATRPGYYLQMKPIKWKQFESNGATSNKPNLNYEPFSTGLKSAKKQMITREHKNSAKHEEITTKLPYNCVDEYVMMMKPYSESTAQPMLTTTPKPPLPTPRSLDNGEYENINAVDDRINKNAKMAKITQLRQFATDANNNSKKHSPTPECPPPSVTQAENAIFEFIQPLSEKIKRKSLRVEHIGNLDLKHFVFDNLSLEDSTETRSSFASDYVEEFVGDVPFAGLFKGSTFTLNTIDNDGNESNNPIQKSSSGLRSPSLVKAVKPVPAKRKLSEPQKSDVMDELNVSKVWAEIDTILESIGNEVSNVDLFDSKEVAKDTLAVPPRHHKPNSIQIRNPSDLVLGVSGNSNANSTTKWCHSADALINGEIIFKVYYLGSTVIRELRGTLSTRKSIQKLKRDETPCFEEVSDKSLVEDCNSFTKILKAKNHLTSLEVGIAFSYLGVNFIDVTNKATICAHDIQNINCVCQDNEDLRYFAYITKENEIHYCHVFMADNLELATEIILTLGQSFEIAYQIALQQKVPPSIEDINISNNTEVSNNL